MSIRAELMQRFGAEHFTKIIERDDKLHGEEGITVVLHEGRNMHTFFFAKDRKITDAHAVDIIKSYLFNGKTSDYLVSGGQR